MCLRITKSNASEKEKILKIKLVHDFTDQQKKNLAGLLKTIP